MVIAGDESHQLFGKSREEPSGKSCDHQHKSGTIDRVGLRFLIFRNYFSRFEEVYGHYDAYNSSVKFFIYLIEHICSSDTDGKTGNDHESVNDVCHKKMQY